MLERKHVEAIQKLLWDANLESLGRHTILDIEMAIGKALAACDQSPWRGMDSAPKDGEAFLAAATSGDLEVAWWSEEHGAWHNGYHKIACTHWMPLPEAPRKDET